MIGETLSHYKILDKLGAGGMGEVYRAEDTTLKRQVALKVLPTDLAASQERLERFQREAETLAALDHPNIVHIHTVEEVEGVHFLTMQLVEGKPLSQLIPKGGMPLERILKIAVPLADALATAHEKGVIHRDLKPANIMVTDEGRVKVLDFGLAKLRQETEAAVATELPTEPLTEEGRLLGTAPYMSPEQIEGRALDSRSDIFSLGIVMYEMAAGERPFHGESSTSTMARILETEPEQLGELRSDLPPEFLRIVRRCLHKLPSDRYNDTRDLRAALKDLRQDSSSQFSGQVRPATVPQPVSGHRRRAIWGALIVVALVVAISGLVLLRRPIESPRASTSTVHHKQITFSGDAAQPEISPDGAFLAFATRKGIVVRDIEGEGSVIAVEADSPWISNLRWSPDGLRLMVSGQFSGEGKTLVVPRLGGGERSLTFYPYLAWSPDGSQVAGAYQNVGTVSILDVESGEIVQATDLKAAFRWTVGIDWSLPINLLLAVTVDDDGRYAIWTLSTTGQDQAKVIETGKVIHSARWSLSESEIYFILASGDDAELWKVGVDPKTGEARDSAKLLLTSLLTEGIFSVSRDGSKLAYTRTASFATIWRTDLEQSSDGMGVSNSQLVSGTQVSGGFSVSPDGEWVAVSKGNQTSSNIFRLSLQDGSMRQLTHLDGRNTYPVWSPDSRVIAFGSTHDGTPRVWRVSPDGGAPQVLDTGDVSDSLRVEWAPGERLLYQQPGNNRWSLFDVGSGDEEPLLSEDLTESGWFFDPVYSRDGSRVALQANLRGNDVITVPVGGTMLPATVISSETGARRGSVSQVLPAAGHQGRAIRLRAKVRVSGDESQARLFLKIRRQNGETGFYEHMRNQPIDSIEWSEHEITGKIDEDASEITLGGWLHGAGAAWFDEFHLSVRDEGGEWETLPVVNRGFEDTSAAEMLTGWRTLSPTETAFAITSEEPSPWGKAMRIEALGPHPADGGFWPVGWSQDGTYVYLAQDPWSGRLHRIPADGGPVEEFLDLELSEELWWLELAAAGNFLVAETVRHQSDIWIAEGFDPNLN